jgi:hypothetical protein
LSGRAPDGSLSAMLRSDRGQTAADYMGVLLVVALIVGALLAAGIPANISGAVEQAICRIAGDACDGGDGGGSPDAGALQTRLNGVAPFAALTGGALEELSAAAQEALERGDLETAQELIERLELYRDLIGAGPRGETLASMVAPTDAEFADLVARGTIQLDGGASNRRYFQIPPAPGQGILAMDLFIPGSSAGPLKGDDRDFADPLRDPNLTDTDSRVIVIIDRETGRGMIVQAESCTVSAFGGDFCNEPRPISINGDLGLIENDSENDATGEGVNLDVTNNYNIHADGDGFRIDYESRNSVSPVPAISGDLTFQPDEDGRLEITEDDRDGFPAYATHQYRPGESDNVIEQREAGSPVELITPPDLPDLPDLPNLPGPMPDLPNLPDLPQLPDPPNPPNLPDLPDLPDLPGRLPDLPNLPDLPG